MRKFFKSSEFGFGSKKILFFVVFGWYFTPWIQIHGSAYFCGSGSRNLADPTDLDSKHCHLECNYSPLIWICSPPFWNNHWHFVNIVHYFVTTVQYFMISVHYLVITVHHFAITVRDFVIAFHHFEVAVKHFVNTPNFFCVITVH